ncbi:MAG: ATP-binding protein [Candidatus Handelsmanbacteria bacterium]|nr:ATP-binding protein [Candidatus Handelsmanbacteria bacterium]
MSEAGVPGGTPCHRCGGGGFYYDPQIEVGRHGELKICTCVEAQCRCGGRPPFYFWDDQARNQRCPCWPARRGLVELKRLFREADVPERYRWKFLGDFHATTPEGSLVRIAQDARLYVSTLTDTDREPERGFLLHGRPGTGKTLLGCIMLNELILNRHRPGRFLNLSKYLQQLRDTYSEESEHYGQTWRIIESLGKVPYLVIDDFGVQRGTEWAKEVLYDLVDTRYAEKRFTVITTNQPLGELQQLSQGRIYSRLLEMCRLVEMEGEDFRQHLQPKV